MGKDTTQSAVSAIKPGAVDSTTPAGANPASAQPAGTNPAGTNQGTRATKGGASKPVASSGFARAVQLLDVITSDGPLRFAELEERLSLPKASLHRALNDLILERLVNFDERSLTYSAGFRILELANRVWARSDIRSLARDQLTWLCEQSGETVQLAVLADTHAVYIDSVESTYNVRMSMSVGTKVPVYCTGTGKVLLAWCQNDEQQDIISRISFAEFTTSTITQTESLQHELRAIREQGFAEDNEEHFTGIRCVAAPIIDNAGQAVAAISITAPTFRIEDSNFIQWKELLLQSVQEISSRLAPVTRL